MPPSQSDGQQSAADGGYAVQAANGTDLCIIQNHDQKKLLAYLNNLSSQTHSHSVQIPMSYTALAQYLTVDRSAMTRELKNLEKEGILTKKGRNIRLQE